MGKYKITIDEEHISVLCKALDLFSRIGAGQFEELLKHSAWQEKMFSMPIGDKKEVEYFLSTIKKLVTGFEANASKSITNAHKDSMIAYELFQILDFHLACEQKRLYKHEPISWSKHPLAEIENCETETTPEGLQRRKFCPKADACQNNCDECEEIKGSIGHDINKAYLESIGKECHCAECADR